MLRKTCGVSDLIAKWEKMEEYNITSWHAVVTVEDIFCKVTASEKNSETHAGGTTQRRLVSLDRLPPVGNYQRHGSIFTSNLLHVEVPHYIDRRLSFTALSPYAFFTGRIFRLHI